MGAFWLAEGWASGHRPHREEAGQGQGAEHTGRQLGRAVSLAAAAALQDIHCYLLSPNGLGGERAETASLRFPSARLPRSWAPPLTISSASWDLIS